MTEPWTPKPVDGDSEDVRTFYESLFERFAGIITVIDVTTSSRAYVSPSFEHLTGIDSETFHSMTEDERAALVHPDDRAAHDAAQQEFFDSDGQSGGAAEYRYRTTSGWRWLSGVAAVLRRNPQDQSITEVVYTAHDVTELREAQAFGHAALEASPAIVVVWDAASGIPEYANPAFTEALGFTVADLRALDREAVPSLVHPDERSMEESAIDEAIATRQPVPLSHRIRTKDGEWRWFSTSYRSFPDAAGTMPRRVLVTSTDITRSVDNERFRQAMLDLSPVMTVVFDADSDETLYASPAFTSQTGYTVEEVNALSAEDNRALTPGHDRDAVDAAIHEALATGQATRVQRRYRHKNGIYRWYDTRFLRFPDPTGRYPSRVLSTALDITDQVALEQLNETIVSSSPISFVIYDVGSARYEWTNPAFVAATGFTEAELNERREAIGDGPVITHLDDIEIENAVVREVLATGEPGGLRHRFICADGEQRTFQSTIVPLPDEEAGRLDRVLVGSVDITEQLLAEQFGETILKASPAPTVVVDAATGETVYANQAFAAATGHTPESLNAMPFAEMLDLTPSTERAGVDAAIERTLDTGEVTAAERTYRGADGTVRWYDSRFLRLPTAAGSQVVITAIDTTERHEAAQALEAERERLARANQDLRDFVHIASHDLQEPLRTVSAFSELLARELPSDAGEEALTHLRFIREGADRMRSLVAGLLELSRLGRHHRATDVDTGTVVRDVVADLANQLEREHATIEVGELPVVRGDDTSLRIVFQNLVSNALKFHSPDRAPHLKIRASLTSGGASRFEVIDNGIGIKAEHQARIFTIFQRLHARDAYEGIGMGLATAKRVVENHGGEIGVESEPGSGSTFWFTLSREGVT